MKTVVGALLSTAALLGCSGPRTQPLNPLPEEVLMMTESPQQDQSAIPRLARGDTSMPVGVGFTVDPDTAMLNLAWDYQLNRIMSMGPSLQFGGSNDLFLFAPTVQIKTYLNAEDAAGGASPFQPYVQGGLGWAWLDTERASESDSNSFLINGGGGVRYRLNRDLSLGSGALINFVPGKLGDDRWYFSWEVLQLVFHF